ncbi:MAG: DNA polymerase III subunit beta [Spirochaetota bacterium]|jgi:DNA polymerase-3 subunit beta|nr:DNA polymerase III subunit beta [Spirochaetota bacterium]
MIFKAARENMEHCLSIAKSITSAKPQLSILTNVLLESKEDRVFVTATDLEVGIRSSFEAVVEEPGSTTINAAKLFGAVMQFPQEEILVEIDSKNEFKIRSSDQKIKAQFTLKGLGCESYPKFPMLPDDLPRFSIAQGTLREMIKKTLFAISTEVSRQYLNGVFFETEKKIFRLVATDGRRLAKIEKTCDYSDEKEMGMIVPQKVLTELSHTLGNEGLVEIAFSENQIFFSFNNIVYASNIIDGHFPNYNQVIPKSQDKKLTTRRETFINILNRSTLLADERQNNQIRFDFQSGYAVVSVHNTDAGSYSDELAIEYAGENIEIAFNIKFLRDFFKELICEDISMEMGTPVSPVIMRPADDENYLYVVMPMKINSESL